MRSPRALSRHPHYTTTGRIVYDRPKHIMTLRDGLRILRRVDTTIMSPVEVLESIQMMLQLLIDIAGYGLRNWPANPGKAIEFVGLVPHLVWLAFITAGEIGEQILKTLVSKILEAIGKSL